MALVVPTFTSTTSALIADTRGGRDRVKVHNAGPGTLYLIEETDDSVTPTVSASNYSDIILAGGYGITTKGFLGKLYGVFSSSGTAKYNVIPTR